MAYPIIYSYRVSAIQGDAGFRNHPPYLNIKVWHAAVAAIATGPQGPDQRMQSLRPHWKR